MNAFNSSRGEKGLMQTHNINKWLKSQSKAGDKTGKTIRDQYIKTVAQIDGEKQINKMFERLDEDGSNSLDMLEICNLFTENGIEMTIEQCAARCSMPFVVVFLIALNLPFTTQMKRVDDGKSHDIKKGHSQIFK